MWFASVRDLQWRRRRFAIGVGATALVFAVTLIMASLSESLTGWGSQPHRRRDRRRLGVIPPEVGGPLPGPRGHAVEPGGRRPPVAGRPPGRSCPHCCAMPIARKRATLTVLIIGHRLGGLGSPKVHRGRAARGTGGRGRGRRPPEAGHRRHVQSLRRQACLRVVGTTTGLSVEGGIPSSSFDIAHSARTRVLRRPMRSAILTRGVPKALPTRAASAPQPGDGGRPSPPRRCHEAVDLVKTLLGGGRGRRRFARVPHRHRAHRRSRGVEGNGRIDARSPRRPRPPRSSRCTDGGNRGDRPRPPSPPPLPAAALVLSVTRDRRPAPSQWRSVVGLLASAASIRRTTSIDPALAFSG